MTELCSIRWWRPDVPKLDHLATPEIWAEYKAHDAREDWWWPGMAALEWAAHDRHLSNLPGAFCDV